MGVTRIGIGDIFESRAQTLVNAVNCVGVIGKGIAREFKQRFPQMFTDYVQRCASGEMRLGEPYLFRSEMGPWILNFPTKGHWRAASRAADIEAGLQCLEAHYRGWRITSLAVPALGCGNGGLHWGRIGPILYGYLSRFTVSVELYAPHGTLPDQLTAEFLSAAGHASITRYR